MEFFRSGCHVTVKEKMHDLDIHSFRDVRTKAKQLEADLEDARVSTAKRHVHPPWPLSKRTRRA